jgi:DNA polymerase-3 subunit beta
MTTSQKGLAVQDEYSPQDSKGNSNIKFSVERGIILKSLSHVQSVVEKRTTIPVLSNVKLDVSEGSLRITATDTEIAISESFPIKTQQAGATTLSAQILYDIIRKIPDGADIEFTQKGEQVEIKAGRSKFKLLSLPVDNFPVMEQGDLPHNFVLGSRDLNALIDKVRFAISNEETRYYLNGIYLHTAKENDSDVLRSAATDGHRLARVSVGMPAGAQNIPGIIIPKKTVNELKKLLGEFGSDVGVALSDSKIIFTLGNITVVSKLIDGKFPDYDRVIPKDNDKTLEVNSKEFFEAVDRVSTVSMEKARAIKIAISTGLVKVSADSPDGSTATEELEASYSADPIETGYNFRYILDMMLQIEGETTQFMLSDSASPAVVRDPSDVSVLYVIMPMRI